MDNTLIIEETTNPDGIKSEDHYVAVCSVCNHKADCQNGFELNYITLTIVDLLSYCTKIKISKNNDPFFICLICTAKLLDTYEFIKQCEKSLQALKFNDCIEYIKKSDEDILKDEQHISKENLSLTEVEEGDVLNMHIAKGKECGSDVDEREDYIETIQIIINKDSLVNNDLTKQKEVKEKSELVETNLNTEEIEQNIPGEGCDKDNRMIVLFKEIFQEQSTKAHIISKKEELSRCEHCNETFKNPFFLKRHQDEKHHEDSKESTKKDQQLCNVCGKAFGNIHCLRNHLRLHEKKRQYQCHFCSKMFVSRDYLKKHVYIHMGIKPFLCNVCGKRFTQSQQLKAHLRGHSGEKPYFCVYCSKTFTNSGTLVCHIRALHTNTRPHVCNVCGKGFVQKPQLRSHLKTHEGINLRKWEIGKEFSCKLCLETFSSRGRLIVHKCAKKHLAPYICEMCGKGFNQKAQFVVHLRIHSGERPFVCRVCTMAFRSQSLLTVHARKHSGEKPYICQTCSKGFAQKQQLNSHQRIHSGEKPFKCEICSKAFTLKGTLTVHLRTHTGETPYICDNCTVGFYASSALKRHRLKCSVFVEVGNKGNEK